MVVNMTDDSLRRTLAAIRPTGARALIVRPGDDEKRPVLLYLATLSPEKSRQPALDSLKRVARAAKVSGGWEAIRWREITVEWTTFVRVRLLEPTPKGLGLGPATVTLTLAALKGVLRQARKLGFFTAEHYGNLVDWPRMRASRLPAGRALTDDEVARLREHVGTEHPVYRALVRGIFAMLLGAGARREEVATLPQDGFRRHELRILGKGRKERAVPLPRWAATDLEAWATTRAGLPAAVQVVPTFFVSVDSLGRVYPRGLSPWAVWNLVVSVTEMAGINGISTHDLRRTYASRLLDATDLPTVQRLMGHANPATTAAYDRRGQRAAEKAVEALEDWGK